MRAAYKRDETDEFIEPTTVGEELDPPGRSVIAFNFRPDRMREITRALAEPGFNEVDRGGVAPEEYATLTEYEGGLALPGRLSARRTPSSLRRVMAEDTAAAVRRGDREVPRT